MTLTEARNVLICHKGLNRRLDEAIDVAVTVLPKGRTRPTVEQRFNSICHVIEKAKPGFTPFGSKTRKKEYVCWRQCIWKKMMMEGYIQSDLQRVTGFNHATIGWGVTQFNGYLECGDQDATNAWAELQQLLIEYEQNTTSSSG